jgi:hypothetical protein
MAKEGTTEEELQESEGELVEATQARLDALNGDAVEDDDEEEDDDQTEEAEEESKSTPDEEEEEEEEEQADEDDDEEESTSEEETVEEDGGTELPEAYMRAAVHQGWDEKEVKDFFEASPEVAMKTFAKIHESTNKLSAEFARLGRVEPEVKTVAESGKGKATETTEEDTTLAALKEEYGADSTMVKAFEGMQVKLAEATKVQEKVVAPEPDSAVQATVDKFFTDPAMKSYADFYGEGKVANKLTVEQMNNRWAMLEMADRIIAGSEKQGREITPEDAMEKAHLSVSEKYRTEALRNELKSKVVKRAKGVTLKPAKSKKVVPEKGAKKSEKQLIAATSAKLKAIF